MMMRNLCLKCVALVLLGLSISPASAAESGFYVGVTLGQSTTEFEKAPLDAAVDAAFSYTAHAFNSEVENNAFSYALFAGYSFNRFLAIEGGYTELADADYHFMGVVSPGFGIGTIFKHGGGSEWATKGFTLSGVGTIPLGQRLDLHARAGVYFAETRLEQFIRISESNVSDDSQEVIYAVGIGYRFTRAFRVAVDYSLSPDVGTAVTGETDVEVTAFTLSFHF